MIQKVIDLFTKTCEKYGDCSWRASQFLDEVSQHAIYIILSRIGNFSNSSVLDVGCGQGSLCAFLKNRFKNVTYTGLDITPKMIEIAQNKNPEIEFMIGDFSTYNFDKKYDWITSVGTFNIEIEDHLNYTKRAIKKMYDLCNKGIAFTMLSSYGYEQAKNFEGMLHCFEPGEMLSYCLSITSSVVINHASVPAEFVAYMYKEE